LELLVLFPDCTLQLKTLDPFGGKLYALCGIQVLQRQAFNAGFKLFVISGLVLLLHGTPELFVAPKFTADIALSIDVGKFNRAPLLNRFASHRGLALLKLIGQNWPIG
jgi:hypothetical protein